MFTISQSSRKGTNIVGFKARDCVKKSLFFVQAFVGNYFITYICGVINRKRYADNIHFIWFSFYVFRE